MHKTDQKNILLVEDDLNLGIILKEYLEVKGYTVTHCLNGEEGSKVFGANKFDLCILDVMMPKKDGFTLAKEIREKDSFTPVAISATGTFRRSALGSITDWER